jgi:hypothetical protein
MSLPSALENGSIELDISAARFLAQASQFSYKPPHIAQQLYFILGAKRVCSIERLNHFAYAVCFPKFIVIAFRGTEKDYEDILTDLDFELVRYLDQKDSYVHKGFYKAAKLLNAEIGNLVKQEDWCNRPIYFTGHSLGGALAQLCALKSEDYYYQIPAVYSYGAPRIGNQNMADLISYQIIHFRFVNGADIVPALPLYSMGYQHAQTHEVYFSRHGELWKDPNWFKRSYDQLMDSARGFVLDGFKIKLPVRRFTRHRISEYRDRIKAALNG